MAKKNDRNHHPGGPPSGDDNPEVRGPSAPAPGGAPDEPVAEEKSAPQLQVELDELMDRLKRVTADYQNYQKRVVREISDARKFANAEFAKEMLTVLDDLERATRSAGGPQGASPAAILDGIRITHEHLTALLARHGVKVIEAAGRPFDPQLHEAMMQRASDQAPPGTVLEELTRGYQMYDRTLRPAKVIVATAPEPAEKKE